MGRAAGTGDGDGDGIPPLLDRRGGLRHEENFAQPPCCRRRGDGSTSEPIFSIHHPVCSRFGCFAAFCSWSHPPLLALTIAHT
jgi:hypothetical protein